MELYRHIERQVFCQKILRVFTDISVNERRYIIKEGPFCSMASTFLMTFEKKLIVLNAKVLISKEK